MKYLLLFAFSLISFSSYSQSFLIMDNGITITTDTLGASFDFGHYAFPQKVTLRGGRFYVEDDAVLATIDDNGLLFKKYEVIPEKIDGKGHNYFISGTKVYGINSQGVLKISENDDFKKARDFGGNFFVVQAKFLRSDLEMYVVNPAAEVIKVDTGTLDLRDVVDFGGNYFMTNQGSIYTVSRDGVIALKESFRVGVFSKKGGNFFVDSSGYLFTIDENGELLMPALPIDLDIASIYKLGSNYFIDMEGRFYVVDKMGNIFEKQMPDHDFRLAKVISM